MSLAKLRKVAMQSGVNIFSEAKTVISKRTGQPKKPKMVGCSTLMKRMNEAGLGHLYKVRQVMMPDMNLIDMNDSITPRMSMPPSEPTSLPERRPDNLSVPIDQLPMPPIADMDFGRYNYYGRYTSGARPKKSQKHVGEVTVKGRTHKVFRGTKGGLYYMKGKLGKKIYIDKPRLRKH